MQLGERLRVSFGIAIWLTLVWPSYACLTFMQATDHTVLVGNNEDSNYFTTKMWTEPAAEDLYGCLFFGYEIDGRLLLQGGINEAGLVYDGLATDPLEVKNSRHKKRYEGNLLEKAMRECATVGEVLVLFDQYNLEEFDRAQFIFVDRSGASAIIEGDAIHRKAGAFQVAANFCLSQIEPGADYLSERYTIAQSMLAGSDGSVDSFTKILAATHQEGEWGQTQYSNIYDLTTGRVYLYHFHNFAAPVVLNLSEELQKEKYVTDIPSLFPPNHAFHMFQKKMRENKLSYLLEKIIDEQGLTAALQKYKEIKSNPKTVYCCDIDESGLNRLGYRYLSEDRADIASAIFKINVEIFPQHWNGYDSLGDAYRIAGDYERARQNYAKSLQLNPQNENARLQLRKFARQ